MSHKNYFKVLFICRVSTYNYEECYNDPRKVSGLRNSATFCVETLNEYNVESKLVVVRDNNEIDREVTMFRPDIVILEALWCVPEKFDVLFKLHPKVKWIIRIHSEIPFMALDGISTDWIIRYMSYKNVYVSGNTERLMRDLTLMAIASKQDPMKLVYLPNCYPIHRAEKTIIPKYYGEIHIGCFGAIRPLKNQLTQALAAIKYAEDNNKVLYFHMNGDRVEQRGEPIKKNIMNLFEYSRHHLVFHEWVPHDQFLELIASMDVSLQVSFSETFNITTADAVANMVPVVVSKEVYWLPMIDYADPNDVRSIANKIWFVLFGSWFITKVNYNYLLVHHKDAAQSWLNNLYMVFLGVKK